MANRTPVPINQRGGTATTQGRLRIGKQIKSQKGSMKPTSSLTFLFSAVQRELIEQVAEQFGGGPLDQIDVGGRVKHWRTETDRSSITVILPPSPLDRAYENWHKKMLLHRCDGVTCEMAVEVRDEQGFKHTERQRVPCVCEAEGWRFCDYKLRLSVILPDVVPFGGTWRLDTGSEIAFDELPPQVAMVQAAGNGPEAFNWAVLRIDPRSSHSFEGRHDYVIPVIELPVSARAIAAGGATAAMLEGPQRRALAAGEGVGVDAPAPSPAWSILDADPGFGDEGTSEGGGNRTRESGPQGAPASDQSGEGGQEGSHPQPTAESRPAPSPDDIVDAEIVHEPLDVAKVKRARVGALLAYPGWTYPEGASHDDVRHSVAKQISKGRTASTRELTDAELDGAIKAAQLIHDGDVHVVRNGGELVFRKVKKEES
jgi:hypothetical protein